MRAKQTRTSSPGGAGGNRDGGGRGPLLALVAAVSLACAACGLLTSGVPEITPGDLGVGLTRGHVTIIDARDKSLYDETRIANAIQVAPTEILTALASTPKDQLVVVYDAGAGGTAAKELARKISASGYERVATLEGGLAAWAAAGKQVINREDLERIEEIKRKFGVGRR